MSEIATARTAVAPSRTPAASTSQRVLQRKCACGGHTVGGGECEECRKNKQKSKGAHSLQKKLVIGASDDPFEREADRVAASVTGGGAHGRAHASVPRIQRLAGSPSDGLSEAPSSIATAIGSAGQPLDSALAGELGERFGHDLSGVRVHSDAMAARSARDVNARAYTVGSDIVFDAGQYAPSTIDGKRLLAHELTHVVQQSAAPAGNLRVQRFGWQDIKDKAYKGMIAGIHKARDATSNGLKRLAGEHLPRALYPIAEFIIELVLTIVDLIIAVIMAVLGMVVGFSEGIVGMIEGLIKLAYGVNVLLYDLVAGIFTNFDAAKQDLSAVWQALKNLPSALKTLVNDWLDKFSKAPTERQSLMIGELTGQVLAIIATFAVAAGRAGSVAKTAAATVDVGAATGEAGTVVGTASDVAATTARARPVLTVIQGGGKGASATARAAGTADRVGSAALKLAPEAEPVVTPLRLVPPLPAAAPAAAPLAAAAPAAAAAPISRTGVGVAIAANAGRAPTEDRSCNGPTGLTREEPISMVWYKVRTDDYYPARLALQGQTYGRDDPSNPRKLPLGEPLGVPEKYWPRPGKRMQLLPEERGSKAGDFRAVLTRYGFDWSGLQADHVQDLDWGGPDSFTNLWPLSDSANLSAGSRQNSLQRITYCESKSGPYVQDQSLTAFKAIPGHYGRWFRIARVER